tara:strand:- start:405 stop:1100 length:696 start_codon:yes stop_codon:yes gene_type:complete
MPKQKKPRFDFKQLSKASSEDVCPPFELQNVVATFNLGVKHLNLRKISLEKSFIEYNPSKFAAATLRLRSPRTTALAFASGNMVVTGAKTEHMSRLASRKYVLVLQRHGIPVCFSKFKIQNIVASSYIPHALNLKEISEDYGTYVSYEPDLFPGLVFRTTNPQLVFLLFRSGKIVITGARTRQQIEYTFNSLYHNVIKHYIDKGSGVLSSSEYRINMRKDIKPVHYFDKTS